MPHLIEDTEYIGTPSVELWVTSDVPAPQLFVRLNVVDSTGRSTNITDTLATVRADPDTPTLVTATLPPTCVRVYAGERLRLVVAGGAFPRFARNPGTGESPVTATTFRVAHIDIHHDAAHPSKVVLPRIPVPRRMRGSRTRDQCAQWDRRLFTRSAAGGERGAGRGARADQPVATTARASAARPIMNPKMTSVV